MPFQSRTLRKLPPDARKLARAYNDGEKALRALKRAVYQVAAMERFFKAEKPPKPSEPLQSCDLHELHQFACADCRRKELEVAAINKGPAT